MRYRLERTLVTRFGKKILDMVSRTKDGLEITYTPNVHLRKMLENKDEASQTLNCGSSY